MHRATTVIPYANCMISVDKVKDVKDMRRWNEKGNFYFRSDCILTEL